MKSAVAMMILFALPIVASAQTTTSPTTAPSTSPTPVRQPKYPLKTARGFYRDAQIALARENVKKYPSARKVADAIIKSADEWAAWSDSDLTFLLISPDVPRAFAVSATGCPVCGGKVKQAGHGDYNWIIDPKLPFKVKCPVDGTVFPTNDYEAYYRSGFKEKKDWDSKYVDDGWGWKDPKTGEKFWFVAYYNHWMWHKHVVPAVHDLARAYLLTGDRRYAHKAAVMLERIAQVYPGMDHAKQSRYGQMQAERGIVYPGKVVNAIWETGLIEHLADAYDEVWETIDADAELQKETGKTGEAIRSFIEANLLEDAIDAVFAGKIRGNFGMHQNALVHLAMARQNGENDKWFDYLLNNPSKDNATLGLNFALYNLIYRDGLPSESSPGYNFLWVNKISQYGDLLQRAGRDVFGNPRVKQSYDGVLDQINAGQFTPSIGDTQSVWGGLIGQDAATFQTAYRYYKDPRYLAFLSHMNATGANTFKTFDSLFQPAIEVPPAATSTSATTQASTAPHVPPRALPPARSRLLDGYGLGILNDSADTTSIAMYYGQKHGHGHFDRLNFELFSGGAPIMPDLGYPDAMNDYVPGIYTWSKNTISHNTVVVDAGRQIGNAPGTLKLFADSEFARVMDVEAKETYPQCSSYRRAIIMVDLPAGEDRKSSSYFVDIFTVFGGQQHDYSLHGPPGEFKMIGGTWSEPAKGTLAGEDVALGAIYDDPKLAQSGATTGYSSYAGSGFQHLFNVRELKSPDTWVAEFKHAKDRHSMLRIRVLDQPRQQILLADAHVSPVNTPDVIRYLIARRRGEKLFSCFVSVIEPFKDVPSITSAITVPAQGGGDGASVRVAHVNNIFDIIRYGLKDGQVTVSVERYDAARKRVTRFGASSNNTPAPITDVLPLSRGVVVPLIPGIADRLHVGQVVRIVNNRHATAHTIASIHRQAHELEITFQDDLTVGLAKIDAIEPQALRTSTALPLAPCYRGTTVTNETFNFFAPVTEVGAEAGKISLSTPLPADQPLKAGDNVWLLDVGPGDSIEVPYPQKFEGDQP